MVFSFNNFVRTIIATTTLTLLSALLLCGSAIGQDAEVPGMKELDKAFDKKINSKSTRDLDEVARLCEQAIKKGLEGDAAEQAKMLAKTAYYEHADQLANRIFSMTSETDPRWQRMRREALRRLEKTVKLDPDMASAYVLMARLNSLPRGDNQEGMDAAQTAIKLIEDDDELLAQALMAKVALTLAGVKNPEGIVDEIMEDIDRAIELDPNNEQARFLRSKLLARSGKITESLADLDAALANSKNANAYKLEANRLITNKQFPESPEMQAAALRYLDKAMELKAEPKLLLTKAIVHQVMKNPEEALAAIDEHIKAEPENVKAYILRAGLNEEEKNFDDAIADLTKAAEIKPDEWPIYSNRIRLHELNEDLEAAITDCKMVLEKKPGESQYAFQHTLARLYLRDERPLAAAKAVTEIVEDYPEGIWEKERDIVAVQLAMRRLEALRLRAGAYLNGGKHKESIDDYELAVDMTDVIYDLQQEIPQRMRAQLNMTDFEGDEGLLNNLAWVLATSTFDELRNGNRAIQLAEKAADLTDYKEAYILSTLASAYAEVGEFEQAIQWSEKAVKRNQEEMEEIEANEELDEEVKEAELKNSAEQLESLKKELASYEDGKPWRELQTSNEKIDDEEEEEESEDSNGKNDEDDKEDDSDDDDEAEDEDEDDEPKQEMQEESDSDDGDGEEGDSTEELTDEESDEKADRDESEEEQDDKKDQDKDEQGDNQSDDESGSDKSGSDKSGSDKSGSDK